MPLRVSNSVERNVAPLPFSPVAIAAGASKMVFPDVSADPQEYAARYIQNAGTNICYVAFGQTECDLQNYNVVLQQYAQLDCSNNPQQVTVFSPLGTTICGYILVRNDNVRGAGGGNNGILQGGGIL